MEEEEKEERKRKRKKEKKKKYIYIFFLRRKERVKERDGRQEQEGKLSGKESKLMPMADRSRSILNDGT